MITGLYEVHLQVSDLARAIAFYQKLGLQLAQREGNTAFFWIVPRQSWIGLWQAEIPHIATKHLAFQMHGPLFFAVKFAAATLSASVSCVHARHARVRQAVHRRFRFGQRDVERRRA
jgi:catechol 2,3-dioxygenase-like lactoylglutathione lyase family enzyme